jgi:ribosomal-protein-alanine N-acetyltransferase
MRGISIRPATAEELQNALNDRSALADVIGGAVPDDWPEKVEMFRFAVERLREHPEEAEWRVYLFFDEAGALVGSGGYQGPPSGCKPDRIVEIGYEIAPAFQKRGLGTAAVNALVERARDAGAVDTMIAQTVMDGKNPSIKLLRRLGFTNTGIAGGPGSGEFAWQWELDLGSAEVPGQSSNSRQE